ncbi:aromatic amino acid transport family protein, partial [Francisella tularensis]|uniref:aromatic amino acid transport family protein n=1 Tax=Francisella tularensis TaxID=263 RepID=UPI002381BC88
LGVFIYISTRIVDHINKIMFSGKLLAFLLLNAVLVPHISLDHLSYKIKNPNFICAAFPILLNSFGYHHIITTHRKDEGSNKRSI